MAFSHIPAHFPQNSMLMKILMILALLLLILFLLLMAERTPKVDRTLLASPVQAHATISQNNTTLPITPPLMATIHTSSLEHALQALLTGPTPAQQKAGVYSEIPKGTTLLGVQVNKNIVTVNLSKEFNSGGGATSAIQRVEELKKTVRSINPNYRLKIAIEGKIVHILTAEGLELDEAI